MKEESGGGGGGGEKKETCSGDHSDLLGHSPDEILMELAVAANACGGFFFFGDLGDTCGGGGVQPGKIQKYLPFFGI